MRRVQGGPFRGQGRWWPWEARCSAVPRCRWAMSLVDPPAFRVLLRRGAWAQVGGHCESCEVRVEGFPVGSQRTKHQGNSTIHLWVAAAAFPAFRHGKSTEHRENGEPCVSLKLIENTSQYQPPHRHHLARVLQQHPPELKRTETRPLHFRLEIGVQPTGRISRL